ncbi:ATP-dependent DNA helicase srs2 [Thecaphora frezii]
MKPDPGASTSTLPRFGADAGGGPGSSPHTSPHTSRSSTTQHGAQHAAAPIQKRPQRNSYLSTLSPSQLRAATHPPTYSLQILAGPGSGKTRVLTSRVAWLILDPANNLNPEHIVVVTFTNKAANEMKSRLNALIGPARTGNLVIGTFHSTCARYLRKYSPLINLSNNFTIADADDSKKIFKAILKDLEESLKADSLSIKPEDAMSEVSRAKARDLSPEEYRQAALKSSASSSQKAKRSLLSQSGMTEYKMALAAIYEKYQEYLREANALDFDDLLVYGVKLFRENPQISRRIHHVLVDEFQDTNTAQYMLMSLMANHCQSISVVGDPDQSIYGWRSAEVGNLKKMCHEFKGTEQVRLEENYRSTGAVLEASLRVVQQDRARVEKGLYTSHPRGPPVVLKGNSSAPKEAMYISREIKRIIAYSGGLLNFNDFAVLLRFNALSRAIEAEFQEQGISNRMIGGHKFFDRMEVKDILGYLVLADNPGFTPAFIRVVNVPKRGIGDKTVADLVAKASKLGMKPMEMAEKIVSGKEKGAGIKPATKKGLAELVSVVVEIRKMANERKPVGQLIETLLKRIDYETWLKREPDFDSRWENVKELISFSTMLENSSDKMAAALANAELETDAQPRSEGDDEFVDPDLDDKDSMLVSTLSTKALSQDSKPSQPESRSRKREEPELIDLSKSSDEEEDDKGKLASPRPPSNKRARKVKQMFGDALLDRPSGSSARVKKEEAGTNDDLRSSGVVDDRNGLQDENEDNETSQEATETEDDEEKTPLRVFLEASILATDVTEAEDEDGQAKPKVTISTCHAAKGLEWPVVFVPAVEEGTYPSFRCEQPHEVDEECRLLYVAMTRAETLLYLTHSHERMVGGQTQDKLLSHFISSIAKAKDGGTCSDAKAIDFCSSRPDLGAKTLEAIAKVTGRPQPDPEAVKESIKKFERSNTAKEIQQLDQAEQRSMQGYGPSTRYGYDSGRPLGKFSGGGSFAPSSSLGAFNNSNLWRSGSYSTSSVGSGDAALRQSLGFSRPSIGSFSTALNDYSSLPPAAASSTLPRHAGVSSMGRASSGTMLGMSARSKRPLMPPSMQARRSAQRGQAKQPPPPPRFTDEMRLRARPEDAIEVASGRNDGMAPRRRADLESFQEAHNSSITSILGMLPPTLAEASVQEQSGTTSVGGGSNASSTDGGGGSSLGNGKGHSAGFGKRRLGMGMARRIPPAAKRGK